MIIRTRNLIFTLLFLTISASASFVIAQDQPDTAKNKIESAGATQAATAAPKPKSTEPVKEKPAQDRDEAKLSSESVFHEIEIEDVSGEKVHFKKYHGKVVLVVNVASKCGFTGQFRPLQSLHSEYHKSGLSVVAFPCNQFGKQEPLTEMQIRKFCQEKFGVGFDVFSKINVKGAAQQELFARLTRLDLKPVGKGDIKWNFEKFLIGKDGRPIARFRSNVSPKDKRIVSKIRAALGLPKLEEKKESSKKESSKKESSKKESSKKESSKKESSKKSQGAQQKQSGAAKPAVAAPEKGSQVEKDRSINWSFTPNAALPNVLILGDSISIGYTLKVRERLQGKANVFRPLSKDATRPANCGGTTRGVPSIDRWLSVAKWDVIHFNWGLHDLKHVKEAGSDHKSNDLNDPTQATLEEYERNLAVLTEKIVATGALPIFATTTPVAAGTLNPLRTPEAPVRYNAVAVEMMKKHGIRVNDLHAHCLPHLKEWQKPRNVHFRPAGSSALAEQVSVVILEGLAAQAERGSGESADSQSVPAPPMPAGAEATTQGKKR